MRWLAILLGLIALGFGWTGPVKGARLLAYSFITFDAPFAGAVNTEGNGINRLGQVVGDYADATGNTTHGYLRNADGSFAMIDVPITGVSTFPFGLNSVGNKLGTIVGTYASDLRFGINHHCFVLNAGLFTTIDAPYLGTFGTQCRGINRGGQIVGHYRDSTIVNGHHRRRGFLLSGRTFSTIDFPAAAETSPRGINDHDQIVGRYLLTDGLYHGFLLAGGSYSSIDYPGATETYTTDINNHGVIVGLYRDTSSIVHAFQLAEGIFTTVALPGAIQNTGGVILDNLDGFASFYVGIFGINDAGVIAGEYLGTDGNTHGFVGTPAK